MTNTSVKFTFALLLHTPVRSFHTKTVTKNYTSPIHIDSFPLKSVDRSANTLVHGRLTQEFCRKREESSIGEALATVISRRRNERALKIELSLG